MWERKNCTLVIKSLVKIIVQGFSILSSTGDIKDRFYFHCKCLDKTLEWNDKPWFFVFYKIIIASKFMTGSTLVSITKTYKVLVSFIQTIDMIFLT